MLNFNSSLGEITHSAPLVCVSAQNHPVWRKLEAGRRLQRRNDLVCVTCQGKSCQGRCRFEKRTN